MASRGLNPLRHIFDTYNQGSLEDRERMRVIGVMGLTGTGKSTFIKKLTNDPGIIIGDDLHSQTVEVSLSRMDFLASDSKSYDVFFADTPGFDDTTMSDTDVLKNIVLWLGLMREQSIKLSGIIYLHRITDNRVGGLAWRNLRMLHSLVGADKMANVLLVSTRWEDQPLDEPHAWQARMEERQKQLEQGYTDRAGKPQQGFWQIYIQNGARAMRHDGSIGSAKSIVNNIITCSTPIYVQIQDEVQAGKGLSQTAAGQALVSDLEKTAERMKEELTNLKEELANLKKELNSEKTESRSLLKQQLEEELSLARERMRVEWEKQRKVYEADSEQLKDEIEALKKRLSRRDFFPSWCTSS